jgi:predicted solute-binding protein
VPSDRPFDEAAAGRPALLIGDRAIDAQQTFTPAHVHDLGTEWHRWTGSDMVFAVWAIRRDVLSAHRADVHEALDALHAALQWGTENPERVVAAAQAVHERPAGFYASYFATLNFSFDAQARAGLKRFFEELRALGAIGGVPPVEPEAFVVHH